MFETWTATSLYVILFWLLICSAALLISASVSGNPRTRSICVFTNLVNYFYHLIHLFIVLFNPLYHILAMGVGVLFSSVIFVRSVGLYENFQPPRR